MRCLEHLELLVAGLSLSSEFADESGALEVADWKVRMVDSDVSWKMVQGINNRVSDSEPLSGGSGLLSATGCLVEKGWVNR